MNEKLLLDLAGVRSVKKKKKTKKNHRERAERTTGPGQQEGNFPPNVWAHDSYLVRQAEWLSGGP